MSNLINWEVLDLVYKHEVGTRKGSAKGKLLPFIASDSFKLSFLFDCVLLREMERLSLFFVFNSPHRR